MLVELECLLGSLLNTGLFGNKSYIFWKRKIWRIFLCKNIDLDMFSKIEFLRRGALSHSTDDVECSGRLVKIHCTFLVRVVPSESCSCHFVFYRCLSLRSNYRVSLNIPADLIFRRKNILWWLYRQCKELKTLFISMPFLLPNKYVFKVSLKQLHTFLRFFYEIALKNF